MTTASLPASDGMCAVYVLSDGADKLYVGQTHHLDRRMQQHAMRTCYSTAKFTSHQLVNYWLAPSRYLALKLECYLQELQRKVGSQALYDLIHDCRDSLPRAVWRDACDRRDTPYQLKFKGQQ